MILIYSIFSDKCQLGVTFCEEVSCTVTDAQGLSTCLDNTSKEYTCPGCC